MIISFLKTTNEFRLESLQDVEAFHKKLQAESDECGDNLSGFTYSKKEIKEGGEVIGEYFVVKATRIFDNAKDPERAPLKSIEYKFVDMYEAEKLAAENGDF